MKDIIQTPEDKRQLESMISMMESLYCYHQLNPDSKYLKKYREYFTEQVFALIYTTEQTRLKENYTIKHNVYTDVEGCTYNSLVPIK
jgi:hypothetical protein